MDSIQDIPQGGVGGENMFNMKIRGKVVEMPTTEDDVNYAFGDQQPYGDMEQPSRAAKLGILGKKVSVLMPDKVCDSSAGDTLMMKNNWHGEEPEVNLGKKKVMMEMMMPPVEQTKMAEQDVMPMDAAGYQEETIDVKLAKKVLPPTDYRDEREDSSQQIYLPCVKEKVYHTQTSLKRDRGSLETDWDRRPHQNLSVPTKVDLLTKTDQLITKVKMGTAEKECLSYDDKVFSHYDNLVKVAHVTSGTFGDVLKVRDTKTNVQLVLKKLKNAKQVEKNEVVVPLQFCEPTLARTFGFGWDGTHVHIIQEDAGVSMREVIKDDHKMSIMNSHNRLERAMCDILAGISILARHGITHCDIKPENVCLDKNWRAKLIDLGSCRTSSDKMTYLGVTPEYMAPMTVKALYMYHMLGKKDTPLPRLGEKDDVFAAGLVALHHMIGAHPMIKWVTGQENYSTCPGNPKMTVQKQGMERKEVLGKMSQLVDELSPLSAEPQIPLMEVVDKLLRQAQYTPSTIMSEVLRRVLVVDKGYRATAAEMVKFLNEHLGLVQHPPSKAARITDPMEAHQALDLSKFVDLGKARQRDGVCPMPPSPEPLEDAQHFLNVDVKQQPGAPQPGGILLPAKMVRRDHQGGQEQRWTMGTPQASAPSQPSIVTLHHQNTAAAPVVSRLQNASVSSRQPDITHDEHDELVEFFNCTLKPGSGGATPPQPQHRPAAFSNVFTERRTPSMFQYAPLQQTYRFQQRGEREVMNHYEPPTNVEGIFGTQYTMDQSTRAITTLEVRGQGLPNIPDMDALLSERSERPILKARRKRGSVQERE